MWFPTDEPTHNQTEQQLDDFPPTPGLVRGTSYGGHSVRETPGHIPNPEAKTDSADGTAGATLWESRTPPDTHSRKATRLFNNEQTRVAFRHFDNTTWAVPLSRTDSEMAGRA